MAAGNGKLMKRMGISYQECHSVGTIIHMAVDGKYAGHIVISDIVKPHSKEAIVLRIEGNILLVSLRKMNNMNFGIVKK